MLGLSITAIGLRPLPDCLTIFDQLRQPLQLDFLELAIGSPCDTDALYPDVPLILHDSCLYRDSFRCRLVLTQPRSWKPYAEFVETHSVAALSVHAPLRKDIDRCQIEDALEALEQTVQVPVFVEVMPSPEYWCSSVDTLVKHPLLLDVSHVLIWHQGDQVETERTCLEMIDRVKAIHLSHNNGRADAHDLIPSEIWFAPYLSDWTKNYFVTYESLPETQADYERLDKRRR
ncbi:hypothetical protein [Leptolyngbya sp. NIES-2104]|uniref:hypothetical protein n=1 Tax=Leptolyngbya sp. NIES-2104 TaxID=1552121 RepID=UPI0006ECA9FD|nr:hypothetical protein [Leptolyngbya sp. NIES-2104]GAP93779.1 hypothetical protein NIES2104_02870 [Leptolyngbya sp. NIES-2104]